MRSSKAKALFRGLTVMAVTALLLTGCHKSSPILSPTEPSLSASLVGVWMGTYNGVSQRCDSSAQAIFQEQPNGDLMGTMNTQTCLGTFEFFNGYLQGSTFTGTAMWGDPEFYPLKGTLSGSSLEITIFNDMGSDLKGTPMGQLHLHR